MKYSMTKSDNWIILGFPCFRPGLSLIFNTFEFRMHQNASGVFSTGQAASPGGGEPSFFLLAGPGDSEEKLAKPEFEGLIGVV